MLAQSAPDPKLLDQILGPLGALALALLVLFFVWHSFSTGLVRVGKQVDEQLEQVNREHDQQLADLKRERDWWRSVALEALGVGERLAARHILGGPSGGPLGGPLGGPDVS